MLWKGMAWSLLKDCIYTNNQSVANAIVGTVGDLDRSQSKSLAYWVLQWCSLDQIKMVHETGLVNFVEDWEHDSIPSEILSENEMDKLQYLIEECGMDPSGWVEKGMRYLESKALDGTDVYRYLKSLS